MWNESYIITARLRQWIPTRMNYLCSATFFNMSGICLHPWFTFLLSIENTRNIGHLVFKISGLQETIATSLWEKPTGKKNRASLFKHEAGPPHRPSLHYKQLQRQKYGNAASRKVVCNLND